MSDEQKEEGRRRRALLLRTADRLLADVDVLLMPVAACGPSRTEQPDLRPDTGGALRDAVLPWTVLANLCGLPACAVPMARDEGGLPVAVQVVGARGSDALVLGVARRLAG
jgi:Asp-tRNA(Asn)/Glu-tRNA(Gln) amidotransferase A subunit family amidase